MKILIVGAGSIGTYLGVKLHASNNEVQLLGRDKLHKLHDTIIIGEEIFEIPQKIYDFPKDATYDIIFITSKLYDLQKNLKLVQKNKVKSEIIVSIQNGLVDEAVYTPYIGESHFTTISIFEGFRLIENHLLVHPVKMGWKTEDTVIGKQIEQVLLDAKINCTAEKNLRSIKAEKLIMNCAINLLSAIYKKTFYELSKTHRKEMDVLFDEAYEVVSKIAEVRSREVLREIFYNFVSKMKHYSSTYQDAISGRTSESRFLNGYITQLGKKFSIPTPNNAELTRLFVEMYK
ncbi:MAG: 2-dehydropantoate 2-reductase [Candidatus Woesearchaeota archaeon]|nr:MAG: 2-dehydropantoate 2-reductase [Candidatus Woesearchaeota archaeon]